MQPWSQAARNGAPKWQPMQSTAADSKVTALEYSNPVIRKVTFSRLSDRT
jgi:hypothetical protein